MTPNSFFKVAVDQVRMLLFAGRAHANFGSHARFALTWRKGDAVAYTRRVSTQDTAPQLYFPTVKSPTETLSVMLLGELRNYFPNEAEGDLLDYTSGLLDALADGKARSKKWERKQPSINLLFEWFWNKGRDWVSPIP